jgi:DNA-binding SARP family transcriptional activator
VAGRLWRIELLGGLRALCGERAVTRFRTRQTGALLAYLALYCDRTHRRDALADRFWPDAEELAARHRLTVALSSLRSVLSASSTRGDAPLITTRESVQLDPTRIATDVADFREARRRADRLSAATDRRDTLTRAVVLYQGELLPGYADAWVLDHRSWLAEQHLHALRDLTAFLAEQ